VKNKKRRAGRLALRLKSESKIMKLKNYFTLGLLMSAVSTNAQTAKITVDVAHPGHAISPVLWGIFFEDINLSADGGLYPELVRNRSFEDADTPENWTFVSTGGGHSEAAVVDGDERARPSVPPLNSFNRKSLRINADGAFTLQNDGYWGMNIVAGDRYTLKFAVRDESFTGTLTAKLLSTNDTVLARGEISGIGGNWDYHTLALTATGGDPQAKLEITGSGQGVLFLDMVSLMPEKTWKDHGLRVDLAEALENLHPAFLRFPGGNWIEGDDIAHMYHWKYTIGNIDTRTPLWNTWGYNTTQGLGFYECLQLCEDLGAKPLFDINCGMALNGISVPMSRMGQWVQDALDAIEYANGPTNSVWGAMRAKAGHPASFHLKYMEIGNENGGPDYWQRWKLMADAIRAKYPHMKLIMTTSLNGYPYPPAPKPDIIDEHYYESPESFMRRAAQYDHYDRNGPKIFVGEYAVTQKAGLGNLRAAIGEAAFMTGLERNSDVVEMASYAPLFVNMNHRAWNPDLINFDNSRWYGIPSYYVQQMFSANRGDVTLPVQVDSPPAAMPIGKGMIGVGTWDTAAEFKDIQVTALDGKVLFTSDFSHGTSGWKLLGDGAAWQVRDGVLRQTAEKDFIRALAGDPTWTDYTLTLKARKLSGAEGFLVLFHIPNEEGRTWWNLGSWGNQDVIESSSRLDPKPCHIETGRWYGLKLTVSGKRIQCWVDGRLVHDLNYENAGNVASLYAAAAKDENSGDLIVKVVNASVAPLQTQMTLEGAKNLTGKGRAIVLTAESGGAENTLAEPMKVSPKTEPVEFSGTTLTRTLPGNSFTVFRLGTKAN
jgi:alpha-L-arabinofuranosidase